MSEEERAQKVVDALTILLAGFQDATDEEELEQVLYAALESVLFHVIALHIELGLPVTATPATQEELKELVEEKRQWEAKQNFTVLPGGKGQREDN